MGNIVEALEEDHRGENDLLLCRISELLSECEDFRATIKNKDHIINGLKSKIKRLKQKEAGRLTKGSK